MTYNNCPSLCNTVAEDIKRCSDAERDDTDCDDPKRVLIPKEFISARLEAVLNAQTTVMRVTLKDKRTSGFPASGLGMRFRHGFLSGFWSVAVLDWSEDWEA